MILLAAASETLQAQDDGSIRPEFAMYGDPRLDVPLIRWRLEEGLLDLWQQALQRPDADSQRLAAEAIAEAASEGLADLEPAVPRLRQLISARDSHPAVLHAAARALIELEDQDSAAALLEAAQRSGLSLRLVVEPALAAWKFEQARSVWRQRLENPQAGRRDLVLALEGLARLQDAEFLAAMLEIVHSPQHPADVRLAAARAAGVLAETGLESDAARLSEAPSDGVLRRLCAVSLLARQSSAAAIELLQNLAADSEPAVAEPALGRLLALDPQSALPLAQRALQSPDPKLRCRGADVYVGEPTAERIPPLLALLDDPHPDVRSSVRDDLYQLASRPELRDAVLEGGLNVLAAEPWRGQEQAALLLGALDHEPAAPRLLELLSSPRPEVMVATAWALRKLAVADTSGPMLEHARQQTSLRVAGQPPAGLDEQVAHLFEALVLMHDPAAEGLFREYVPKRAPYGYYSRGAAIWALGLLHAGEPDEALATQLMQRLNDYEGMNPELDIVFEMSAVTLGRMQAASQVASLRERLSSSNDRTLLAVRWALEEITGETLPLPPPPIAFRTNWFLEPIASPRPPQQTP